MLFSEHDRVHDKNFQCLGAFTLLINVIHKMLYFLFCISSIHPSGTFSSELLTSPVERHLLPGSSILIYSSRRTTSTVQKEGKSVKKSVSKELQSLTT